jgi:hypothetical protein
MPPAATRNSITASSPSGNIPDWYSECAGSCSVSIFPLSKLQMIGTRAHNSCKKTHLFLSAAFPMFIPSLSW